MRLRGRGRVRQGVCPFHEEVEGSFTVYADSERFYCFGCGLGGDVLDFIQQAEGLFDWLALTGWGIPTVAALGTQGVERVASSLRGCPRVFLAFDSDDAGREATERLLTLLGRRAAVVALPQGVGDVGELAARPHGQAAFIRLLAQAARSAR